MTLKIRVTFLTATLPVRLESEYRNTLKLPENHVMIRADTNRPEHQYIVLNTSKDELSNHTLGFIHHASTLLSQTQRAIIFVRSKAIGNTLKNVFPDIGFIHGAIKDDKARAKMIADWETGRSGGWIIGTTSLIQGVDYHNVHLVVFAAPPFGMVDFVQGAGRAGRNGKSSKVVVLDTGTPIYCSKDDITDLECKREMAMWLGNRHQCRRIGISKCMDGNPQTCLGLPGSAARCDVCSPEHDLHVVWEEARKFDFRQLSQRPKPNLVPGAQGTSLKPAAQLAVVPLRPQLAPPDVLRKSAIEMVLLQTRIQTAIECIYLLEAFSPNCGICHAESGTLTGERHSGWTICKPPSQAFAPFYLWNKPMTKGETVRDSIQIRVYY